MIVLNISCIDCENSFEGWFASKNSCVSQIKKKLVECSYCGSTNVEKSLSSPNFSTVQNNIKQNKIIKEMKEKIIDMQNFVEKNAEYVGDQFVYEARRNHYDKVNKKPIYGNAKKQDIEELHEEGIKVKTIPWIKKMDS